jgi:hypothetical protein
VTEARLHELARGGVERPTGRRQNLIHDRRRPTHVLAVDRGPRWARPTELNRPRRRPTRAA